VVTVCCRIWLVPLQGRRQCAAWQMSRRHLLALETTVFTAAWVLPTSSAVSRGITRTCAFAFPSRKKKSSDVDQTNKEAKQLALRVQRTFSVYVALNHRRKCSPQCAAAPWNWNHHARLTAKDTYSTVPLEQFIENYDNVELGALTSNIWDP
jgi:hypothetical protein